MGAKETKGSTLRGAHTHTHTQVARSFSKYQQFSPSSTSLNSKIPYKGKLAIGGFQDRTLGCLYIADAIR